MGYTSLAQTAWNRHEAVVELLVSCAQIDLDKPNEDGYGPLMLAACDGGDGVVRMLLGRRGASPGSHLRTAKHHSLLLANCNGRGGVVKMLLRQDNVNPNKLDQGGEARLGWGVRNRDEGVGKMLLGRHDVNPKNTDEDS